MSVPDSQVPSILGVSMGPIPPMIVKFSSPSSLPSVFMELKYKVPSQYNVYFDMFFVN